MPSRTAVLFDIDGTLVRRTGPAHRDALAVACYEVLGLHATTEGIPVHGMLDTDILTAMLTRAGCSPDRAAAAMPALQAAAEESYLRVSPDLRHRVCPGVRPLLHRLQNRKTPLALVTGNFEKIGWRKLQGAGLARYFRHGAFAGMAPTRGGLAAIAARQLNATGRVLLIGDSPNDIEAARANGFVAVAVHTGVSTREELAQYAPNHLLGDLRPALRLT